MCSGIGNREVWPEDPLQTFPLYPSCDAVQCRTSSKVDYEKSGMAQEWLLNSAVWVARQNTTEQLMQAGQQVETIIPHYFVYNFF